MADKQAERIKFEIELLRLIAIAVLAIGGGSIGLLLGDLAVLRIILAGGGLFVTVALMWVLWWQRQRILSFIH